MKYIFLLLLFYSVVHLGYQWPDSFEMERKGKKSAKFTDKINKTSECNNLFHHSLPLSILYIPSEPDMQPKLWITKNVHQRGGLRNGCGLWVFTPLLTLCLQVFFSEQKNTLHYNFPRLCRILPLLSVCHFYIVDIDLGTFLPFFHLVFALMYTHFSKKIFKTTVMKLNIIAYS